MKKILSLFVAVILTTLLVSCKGENKIKGYTVDGLKEQYYVDEVIETKDVVLTVLYDTDSTANYTVKADELEFVLPDMTTTGIKTVGVKYKDRVVYEHTIIVVERTISAEDLVVKTGLPEKTIFVGDEIDLSGVVLTYTYYIEGIEGLQTEELTYDDFKDEISEFSTTEAGQFNITITHAEKTVTIPYTVVAVQVSKLEVKTGLAKTEYMVGDEIDYSTITATATYNNGTTEEVLNKDLTITEVSTDTTGEKTVIVSYEGKSFNITVNIDSVQNNIESMTFITKIADKTYYVGDTIDTSTIEVEVAFKDGRDAIRVNTTNGLTVTGVDTTKAQTISISCTYEGYTSTFTVVINEVLPASLATKTGLAKAVYFFGDVIDYSTITATLTYNNNTTKTIENKNLNITKVSTDKIGEKTITVSYKEGNTTVSYTIKITVEHKQYDYTIIGFNAPKFVQTNEENRDAKPENKQNEYYKRNNTYVVGSQNPFVFLPEITATKNEGGDVVTPTEYLSVTTVKIVEETSNRLLEGEELAKYVTVDEYKSTLTFTKAANGHEFIITVRPYYDNGNEDFVTSLQFKVVDAYNIYETHELAYIVNTPTYRKYWSDYFFENNLGDLKSVNSIVLHNNFNISSADLPKDFIHQDGVDPKQEGINYHTTIVKGSLKDGVSLFEHRLASDEHFAVYGNYFTIDASQVPVVSNYGWDGSNSNFIHIVPTEEGNVKNMTVTFENFSLFGNAHKSADDRDYGGLIATKYSAEYKPIVVRANNLINQNFFINTFSDYEKAEVYYTDVKAFDSYGNAGYIFADPKVSYSNCHFAKAGGPLFIAQHVLRRAENKDDYLDLNFDTFTYESTLFGNESWFINTGQSSTALMLIQLNELFKQMGHVQGFVKKVDGRDAVSIPMVIDYATTNTEMKKIDKGIPRAKLTMDGKMIVNTVDDVTTLTNLEVLRAFGKDAGGIMFTTANGGTAFLVQGVTIPNPAAPQTTIDTYLISDPAAFVEDAAKLAGGEQAALARIGANMQGVAPLFAPGNDKLVLYIYTPAGGGNVADKAGGFRAIVMDYSTKQI